MNSEKNYINNTPNLYIDAGNQLLKVGYQINDEWIIEKIPNHQLGDIFFDTIKKFQFLTVYWCSVCKTSTSFLTQYFKKNKIDNYQVTAKDFIGKLVINDQIDIHEVGVDILCYCYYIKLQPKTLAISFGTATVAIYYNLGLEGVVIGADFNRSYDNLHSILGIDGNQVMMHDDFGINTSDAINGAKYFMLNGFVNEMLADQDIDQIYVSGGNKSIFNIYKNKYNKHLEIVDEIILKGLSLFIQTEK